MTHTFLEQPAADAFVNWAMTARPGLVGLGNLAEALAHPGLDSLEDARRGLPELPREALAVLLACLGQVQEKSPDHERHYLRTGVDFVASWALASPLREESQDPNEQRFLRWAQAASWEEFFAASVLGTRVLVTYRRTFDLRTLYHWITCQVDAPEQFARLAMDSFTTWQAPADWVPPVDASRHDPAHCRALLKELFSNGWERSQLSARLGVTSQYLGLIEKEKRSASYGLQVELELIRGPVKTPTLKPTQQA